MTNKDKNLSNQERKDFEEALRMLNIAKSAMYGTFKEKIEDLLTKYNVK